MAAPTFVAAGNPLSAVGSFTVSWPVHEADDIGLLVVETANQAAVLDTAAGFVEITNQGTGTAGTDAATRLTFFWCRATSSSMTPPVVGDSGARQQAVILTFRGCETSGNPWDVFAGSVQAAASASIVIPGATTTGTDRLCVLGVSNSNGIGDPEVQPTPVNSSLTNVTKRISSQPDGLGGGVLSTALPLGVFSGNPTLGLGPGGDSGSPKWTAAQYAPQPSTISDDIDTADANNITLVLTFPGNKGAWNDAQGNFSYQLYVQRLQRFAKGTPFQQVSDAVADKITDALNRRRIICYIVDEPNITPGMTPTVVNNMAGEHKALWPGCITAVRTAPSTLKAGFNGGTLPPSGWTNVDYAWAQYSLQHSQPNKTFAQMLSDERTILVQNDMNMGLITSLNIWAGGNHVDLDGVAACWDVRDDGTFSGYIAGTHEANETAEIPCGTDVTRTSVIASPAWIERYAEVVGADPDIPLALFWNYAPGTSTDNYAGWYTRSDYTAAFDYALGVAAARSSFSGWRTAK